MADEDGLEVRSDGEEGSSVVMSCRDGHHDRPVSERVAAEAICECLPHMLEAGFVKQINGKVAFTPQGRARAEVIIRSHRLAEALLDQALDMDVEAEQETVCRLEHALSPAIADHICAFLGHPPTCPHGRPIPRGACCARVRRDIAPLVLPLADAAAGRMYRITFITSKHNGRLDRLAVLGVTPDTDIWLQQKRPSFVLRSGETDIAVDKDIARDIYVRPV